MREPIVEGTGDDLGAAQARGQSLGRPSAPSPDQVRRARLLLTRPERSVSSVARLLGVPRTTVHKHVTELRADGGRDGSSPAITPPWTQERNRPFVAGRIAEVQVERAALERRREPRRRPTRLEEPEIATMVDALGGIGAALSAADPDDKAELYRRLYLGLLYHPDRRVVTAQIDLDSSRWVYGLCPRGDVHASHTLQRPVPS